MRLVKTCVSRRSPAGSAVLPRPIGGEPAERYAGSGVRRRSHIQLSAEYTARPIQMST